MNKGNKKQISNGQRREDGLKFYVLSFFPCLANARYLSLFPSLSACQSIPLGKV